MASLQRRQTRGNPKFGGDHALRRGNAPILRLTFCFHYYFLFKQCFLILSLGLRWRKIASVAKSPDENRETRRFSFSRSHLLTAPFYRVEETQLFPPVRLRRPLSVEAEQWRPGKTVRLQESAGSSLNGRDSFLFLRCYSCSKIKRQHTVPAIIVFPQSMSDGPRWLLIWSGLPRKEAFSSK